MTIGITFNLPLFPHIEFGDVKVDNVEVCARPDLGCLRSAVGLASDASDEQILSTALKRLEGDNPRMIELKRRLEWTQEALNHANAKLEEIIARWDERFCALKAVHDELGTREFDAIMHRNGLRGWKE